MMFLAAMLVYAVRRRRFPLFRIRGTLEALRIGRRIGLTKLVNVGPRWFSALTLPHYPSKAFTAMVANGGLNTSAAGTRIKKQIDTAILAITGKCDLHCAHCYERFSMIGPDDVTVEVWNQVIADIQEAGTSVIVLSGGEPLQRFGGLLDLLRAGDKDSSDFHLHTSGHGLTRERAAMLHDAGLVAAAVGLDDVDPHRHDRLRGRKGAHREALDALALFRDAGIMTYVNCCLSPDLVRSGRLHAYYDRMKELGVGFLQLLEPRPCGGYLEAGSGVFLNEDERAAVFDFAREGNSSRRYRDYPVVYSVAWAEGQDDVGCGMGGLSHFSIDSRGNVTPCVFMPVAFGNITRERFPVIYERMRRAIPRPLRGPCPAFTITQPVRSGYRSVGEMPVDYRAIEAEWTALYTAP
jgi:MoaA/NifB/PqqE/SkfB family radical SAM enzyme